MLTQWCLPPPPTSTVKSLFTHAHSSPLSLLPGHVHVAQTILLILTMAGLFPDRPRIWKDINSGCVWVTRLQTVSIFFILFSHVVVMNVIYMSVIFVN